MDAKEIWLMETAGRMWAARRVDDWAAISNCYSIGGEFDLCSPGLEEYARSHRWLRPDERFDFAKAYTLPALRQGQSTPRWRRMMKLIADHGGPLDQAAVKSILRDHFEGELIAPRWGGCYGSFVSICMHAINWDASQTAASLMCSHHEVLGPVSWYAPSLPCCSVYIPVYWTGDVPHAVKCASESYSDDSLWWRTERLAMLISVDEERFAPSARKALRELEADIRRCAADAEEQACALVEKGRKDQAFAFLSYTTEKCTDKMMTLVSCLAQRISDDIRESGGLYGVRKEFIEAYAERVKMPL